MKPKTEPTKDEIQMPDKNGYVICAFKDCKKKVHFQADLQIEGKLYCYNHYYDVKDALQEAIKSCTTNSPSPSDATTITITETATKEDAAIAELKKQLHFIKNCAENLRTYRRDLKGHLPKSKVDNPHHVKMILQDIGFTANCLDKNANKAEQVAQNLFRETWKDGYFEGTVDTSNELNDEIDRLKKAPEIWKDIQEAIKDFKVGGKDGISLLAGSDISKFALRLVEIQKKV